MTNTSDLRNVIAVLAGMLGSSRFPKGDLAELRRMTNDSPPLPFWRVLYDYVPEAFRMNESMENNWITLLNGMAIMAPEIHSEAPSHSVGAIFASFPVQRINTFLRSKDKNLSDQIRLFARLCISKNMPVDWGTLAQLLFYSDKKSEEKIKRDIAKDYIQAKKKKEDVA